MTSQELDRHFDVIKDFHTKRQEAELALGKLCNESFIYIDLADNLETEYVKLLSQMVGDKAEWISWYIYENDFGADGMAAGLEDEMISIDNTDKLLRLINLKVGQASEESVV